ncbi:flippase [Streptococcus suis]
MSKISKNYIYNLSYQVVVLILPLLMTPYIARVLGARQLGIYDYCNSIVTLIYTIGLLGIGHYGNRECAYARDDKKELSETFWTILSVQFVLGVISIIVLYLFSFFSYQYEFLLFSIWLFGSIIDCTWFYRGMEEMQYVVLKNIIAKLLFAVATFLLVKTADDLYIYIFVYGLSTLVANISAYTQLRNYVYFPNINLSRILEIVIESLKLFLPSVVMQLLLSADKIVLGTLGTGISNVSYYSNAEKIIQIPLSLVVVLNSVMMPRIANEFRNGRMDSVKKYLIGAAEFSMFLSIPLSVGIFAISDFFIPWFLGPDFSPSIVALKWLAPIAIGNALIGVSGSQYLVAINRTSILLMSNSVAAILNITIDVLLAPSLGIVGVCIATLISLTSSVCIQYYYMSKEISIKPIIKCIIKYFLMAAIMGFIIIIPFRYADASVKTTVLQVMLGVIVYLVSAMILKDKFIFEMINLLRRKMGQNK